MVMPGVFRRSTRNWLRPPWRSSSRTGTAEQDHILRQMGKAGPHLGAVDEIAALNLHRPRAYRGEVGPDIGLAHADTNISLAGRDLGQDFLLLVRTDPQDQRSGLPVGDPVQADRCAGGEHFLQHDIAFERGTFVAAVLLRPGHADPAAPAHGAGESRDRDRSRIPRAPPACGRRVRFSGKRGPPGAEPRLRGRAAAGET